MQAQLVVGPISSISHSHSRRRLFRWVPLAAEHSHNHNHNQNPNQNHNHNLNPNNNNNNKKKNHYAVLGVNLFSSSSDIKSAFRFLALKYHPDVSKDSRASEVFKRIRLAYEVLSNEATRTDYDRTLKLKDNFSGTENKRQRKYDPELDNRERIDRWDELRRKTRHYQHWEDKNRDKQEEEEEEKMERRGTFVETVRSAFVSLVLLHFFGSRLSLFFTGIVALLDGNLDGGYKMGYLVAWILGGKVGILLTLCLSFASWVFGKTSSGVVSVVLVAMGVGSGLARLVPVPRGALLTLLYMSIKLQLDLN